MGIGEIGMHAAAGFTALAVAFCLFACGWIGGGDAKLAAATALWLGFDQLLPYLFVASLLGGAGNEGTRPCTNDPYSARSS